MNERGSKTLTGLFVLGALALVCAAFLILGSGSLFRENSQFVLFFESSPRGLSKGSPVYFKGVKVGKVTSVQISARPDDMSFRTPVIIEIESQLISGEWTGNDGVDYENFMDDPEVRNELIARGLRASLGMLSFITGQLAVELDVNPSAAPIDIANLAPYEDIPQLPTMASDLDAVLAKFSRVPLVDIANKFLQVLTSVDNAIADARVSDISASVLELSNELKKQAEALGGLQVSGKEAVADFRELLGSIQANLEKLSARLNTTLADVSGMSKAAQKTAVDASNVVNENSSTLIELSQTMRALREAAFAVSQFATMLETQPDALIFGKGR